MENPRQKIKAKITSYNCGKQLGIYFEWTICSWSKKKNNNPFYYDVKINWDNDDLSENRTGFRWKRMEVDDKYFPRLIKTQWTILFSVGVRMWKS